MRYALAGTCTITIRKLIDILSFVVYWCCKGYYPTLTYIEPEEYFYGYADGQDYCVFVWGWWAITLIYPDVSVLSTKYYWINKGNGFEFVGPFEFDYPMFAARDPGKPGEYDDICF